MAKAEAKCTCATCCVLVVPSAFEANATPDKYWMYEVPIPVRFVLEKGWRPLSGTDAVVVDVPYDKMFGAMVPEGYWEF